MEAERLVKQFIKDYKYGGCIMYGTDRNGLFVLWKHWAYSYPETEATRIYIGKIKISLKLTYKWLD